MSKILRGRIRRIIAYARRREAQLLRDLAWANKGCRVSADISQGSLRYLLDDNVKLRRELARLKSKGDGE